MAECKVSIHIVTKILTVLVALLIAVDSVLTIITLGLARVSVFIMAFYYLYIPIHIDSSQSCWS
jgi:hypothetical protein